MPTLSQRDSNPAVVSSAGQQVFAAYFLRVGQMLFAVNVAIYAPMTYTAPYIIFLMHADPLRGKWEGAGPWKSRLFRAL